MDCCFGLLGKDYVLLAADGTIAMSIMKITVIYFYFNLHRTLKINYCN
jgi:hypothetical protein